jgi:hypothetical protein
MGLNMRIRPEKILEYVACPQFGNTYYGEWGILNIEQRRTIKELCEYTLLLENIITQMEKEELEKCSICNEPTEDQFLTDTEGLPNGNVGKVCPDCLEDMK